MSVLDRFLRYVTVDTRADESSIVLPEHARTAASCSALLAARTARHRPGRRRRRRARLPDGHGSGDDRARRAGHRRLHRARRHVAGDGRREREADRPPRLGRPRHRPARRSDRGPPRRRRSARWRRSIGHDIVTASGTTLLGADDKAGVAIIVAAAAHLMAHPEIPHGTDPHWLHAGRGDRPRRGPVRRRAVRRRRAPTRWTAATAGELEFESFSADVMRVTFIGFNTHPGYARGSMVNAIKAAARFVDRLPRGSAVAGDDRRVRRLRASLPDGRVGRSDDGARAAARLRDGAAARAAGARRGARAAMSPPRPARGSSSR